MALPPWFALLQDTLQREGTFRWTVQGTSMVPTLRPGTTIEIVPATEPIALGALVVFARRDSLVVHRLVRRTNGQWITQGDGRSLPDPPIDREQVLGIAARAYEADREYWPGRTARVLAMFWLFRYHVGRVARIVQRRISGLLHG
ncbi:MAG: S24/S26 family peptidase [Ardenticatenales bacterium]|nr:S24/S26 family peptidase [Ardenticatenales bacterium]